MHKNYVQYLKFSYVGTIYYEPLFTDKATEPQEIK